MSIDLQENLVLGQRPRLKEACIKLYDLAQDLGPEAKLPTMLELRDQIGVSMKTLNSAVRELEKRQVLYSINGVGVYVAAPKPRLQVGTLGYLTNNLGHAQNYSYWGQLIAGMRAEAEQRDRHMLLIDNGERFHQWEKVDGAILTDIYEKAYGLPPLPHPPKGLPSLALLNALPGMPSVTVDDRQSVSLLARHLIELGHRRIAYLATFDEGLDLIEQRRKGYLDALKGAGIPADESLMRHLFLGDLHLNGEEFENIGERHLERWLSQDFASSGCTAIMAQNDATARGIITALRNSGRRVPEDISVTGFDGLETSLVTPALTTVKIPLFDLGRHAVRLLCEWLDNPARHPDSIALPGELVVGATSAPSP